MCLGERVICTFKQSSQEGFSEKLTFEQRILGGKQVIYVDKSKDPELDVSWCLWILKEASKWGRRVAKVKTEQLVGSLGGWGLAGHVGSYFPRVTEQNGSRTKTQTQVTQSQRFLTCSRALIFLYTLPWGFSHPRREGSTWDDYMTYIPKFTEHEWGHH